MLDLATGDTAGFGSVGLGVTVAFPVMQLSVLHGTVVPSMVIDTHLAGFYSPDPACQSALVRLRGVTAISLNVLGLELLRLSTRCSRRNTRLRAAPAAPLSIDG